MINPDVLRQLAADLDAKFVACRIAARSATGYNRIRITQYNDGSAASYAYAAARIREILDDETTEQGNA